MSSFSTRHGQTGGGGVRRPGAPPPPGGSSRPSPSGGPRDQPGDTITSRWPGYLDGGYFDEQGNLKPEYVARCIPGDEMLPDHQQHGVEPLIRAMANGSPKLTTGQVRRFFGHCRVIETRLKSGATDWGSLRTRFKFLDAAAADAFGKQPRKIPGLFYDFIRRNVAAVHSEKDFLKGFIPHFEALVGFASLHVEKDRN